jgi:hypothetical protein
LFFVLASWGPFPRSQKLLSRVTRDRCYDFKNIFAEKNVAKNLAFLTQNKAKLWKILIITLVFEKNTNFFAKNRQKQQKIVIITLTPDWANFRLSGDWLLWAEFFKITVVVQTFRILFPWWHLCIIFC